MIISSLPRLSLSLPSSLPPPLRELAFLIVLATVTKYLMKQDREDLFGLLTAEGSVCLPSAPYVPL